MTGEWDSASQEEELQKKKIVTISISSVREKLHPSGIKHHRRMNWQMYQGRTVNSTELCAVHQNRISKWSQNPQGWYSNQNTHTHTQIHCVLLLFNTPKTYTANGKKKQYKRASSVRDLHSHACQLILLLSIIIHLLGWCAFFWEVLTHKWQQHNIRSICSVWNCHMQVIQINIFSVHCFIIWYRLEQIL